MAQFNVPMNITLELNEIDYRALVEQFFPLVRDKLAEKYGTVTAILSKVAGMLVNKNKDTVSHSTKLKKERSDRNV